MELRSLGLKTDLMILGFENRVEDKGGYIVAETVGNPGYFWGNLLAFKEPPTTADVKLWPNLFKREFAHQPLVKHCTLAWDTPTGEIGAAALFEHDEFKIEESIVLTANEVYAPLKRNDEVVVRPLVTDEDWEQAVQSQLSSRLETFKLEMYEPFKRTQMARYRRMSEAGLGFWYGAFLHGRLVADLGLFVREGVGRYQAVGTFPEFRRRGICGTLVWLSAVHAQAHLGAQIFVMVADENYHAAKIYESVGFRPQERQIGVYKFPKDEWAT